MQKTKWNENKGAVQIVIDSAGVCEGEGVCVFVL